MHKPHLRYKKQTPRERTWTIHFISLEKTVKGIVLVIVGFRLLTLFDRDVHAWAEDFVTRHGIDLANRYVQSMLERLSGVGNRQIVMFSVGAFIYAALLFTEGIGLWLQKRWAEYLTAFATALFIPIELYELYERFTWVRIAIVILNVFVVWYLVTRLRDEKNEVLVTENTTGSDSSKIEGIRVKICGITNLEDAKFAIESGADELGFNFYGRSSRYIEPQIALKIIKKLPRHVIKIGVFVNEEPMVIREIVEMLGLTAVQLHGDEDTEFISELRKETDAMIIKAFRVSSDFTPDTVSSFEVDGVLLDAYSATAYGGTGKSFDWQTATSIKQLVPTVYLAGGLTPENVAEAVRIVKPYAVDVASGVESSPGKKDPEKVAAFIKAAKEAL